MLVFVGIYVISVNYSFIIAFMLILLYRHAKCGYLINLATVVKPWLVFVMGSYFLRQIFGYTRSTKTKLTVLYSQ